MVKGLALKMALSSAGDASIFTWATHLGAYSAYLGVDLSPEFLGKPTREGFAKRKKKKKKEERSQTGEKE
ncbi:hypothetical protein N7539_009379 [Penicillium diatomitis]|uniref:Uncharacterized protein n=1 Tax=Penicillium diatomitis TaxID=2819901 RepID=A0A9W9WKJ6_9EURO|nr:uncharacterized protein N7539_009379 [Penicillium diatomitis]KAJ5466650.1 hypothetical protein N7539_009379 [Penicillium diatomitis]